MRARITKEPSAPQSAAAKSSTNPPQFLKHISHGRAEADSLSETHSPPGRVVKGSPKVKSPPGRATASLPAAGSNEAPDFKAVVKKAILKVKQTPEQPPVIREPTPVVLDDSLGREASLPLPLATDLIPLAGDFHRSDAHTSHFQIDFAKRLFDSAANAGLVKGGENTYIKADKEYTHESVAKSTGKEYTNESLAKPSKEEEPTDRGLIGKAAQELRRQEIPSSPSGSSASEVSFRSFNVSGFEPELLPPAAMNLRASPQANTKVVKTVDDDDVKVAQVVDVSVASSKAILLDERRPASREVSIPRVILDEREGPSREISTGRSPHIEQQTLHEERIESPPMPPRTILDVSVKARKPNPILKSHANAARKRSSPQRVRIESPPQQIRDISPTTAAPRNKFLESICLSSFETETVLKQSRFEQTVHEGDGFDDGPPKAFFSSAASSNPKAKSTTPGDAPKKASPRITPQDIKTDPQTGKSFVITPKGKVFVKKAPPSPPKGAQMDPATGKMFMPTPKGKAWLVPKSMSPKGKSADAPAMPKPTPGGMPGPPPGFGKGIGEHLIDESIDQFAMPMRESTSSIDDPHLAKLQAMASEPSPPDWGKGIGEHLMDESDEYDHPQYAMPRSGSDSSTGSVDDPRLAELELKVAQSKKAPKQTKADLANLRAFKDGAEPSDLSLSASDPDASPESGSGVSPSAAPPPWVTAAAQGIKPGELAKQDLAGKAVGSILPPKKPVRGEPPKKVVAKKKAAPKKEEKKNLFGGLFGSSDKDKKDAKAKEAKKAVVAKKKAAPALPAGAPKGAQMDPATGKMFMPTPKGKSWLVPKSKAPGSDAPSTVSAQSEEIPEKKRSLSNLFGFGGKKEAPNMASKSEGPPKAFFSTAVSSEASSAADPPKKASPKITPQDIKTDPQTGKSFVITPAGKIFVKKAPPAQAKTLTAAPRAASASSNDEDEIMAQKERTMSAASADPPASSSSVDDVLQVEPKDSASPRLSSFVPADSIAMNDHQPASQLPRGHQGPGIPRPSANDVHSPPSYKAKSPPQSPYGSFAAGDPTGANYMNSLRYQQEEERYRQEQQRRQEYLEGPQPNNLEAYRRADSSANRGYSQPTAQQQQRRGSMAQDWDQPIHSLDDTARAMGMGHGGSASESSLDEWDPDIYRPGRIGFQLPEAEQRRIDQQLGGYAPGEYEHYHGGGEFAPQGGAGGKGGRKGRRRSSAAAVHWQDQEQQYQQGYQQSYQQQAYQSQYQPPKQSPTKSLSQRWDELFGDDEPQQQQEGEWWQDGSYHQGGYQQEQRPDLSPKEEGGFSLSNFGNLLKNLVGSDDEGSPQQAPPQDQWAPRPSENYGYQPSPAQPGYWGKGKGQYQPQRTMSFSGPPPGAYPPSSPSVAYSGPPLGAFAPSSFAPESSSSAQYTNSPQFSVNVQRPPVPESISPDTDRRPPLPPNLTDASPRAPAAGLVAVLQKNIETDASQAVSPEGYTSEETQSSPEGSTQWSPGTAAESRRVGKLERKLNLARESARQAREEAEMMREQLRLAQMGQPVQMPQEQPLTRGLSRGSSIHIPKDPILSRRSSLHSDNIASGSSGTHSPMPTTPRGAMIPAPQKPPGVAVNGLPPPPPSKSSHSSMSLINPRAPPELQWDVAGYSQQMQMAYEHGEQFNPNDMSGPPPDGGKGKGKGPLQPQKTGLLDILGFGLGDSSAPNTDRPESEEEGWLDGLSKQAASLGADAAKKYEETQKGISEAAAERYAAASAAASNAVAAADAVVKDLAPAEEIPESKAKAMPQPKNFIDSRPPPNFVGELKVAADDEAAQKGPVGDSKTGDVPPKRVRPDDAFDAPMGVPEHNPDFVAPDVVFSRDNALLARQIYDFRVFFGDKEDGIGMAADCISGKVVITKVKKHTPIFNSGLMKGMILLEIGKHKFSEGINAEGLKSEFLEAVALLKTSSENAFNVRAEIPTPLVVKLAAVGGSWGFACGDPEVPDVITSVVPGGPADQVGIVAGMEIIKVNHQFVSRKEGVGCVFKHVPEGSTEMDMAVSQVYYNVKETGGGLLAGMFAAGDESAAQGKAVKVFLNKGQFEGGHYPGSPGFKEQWRGQLGGKADVPDPGADGKKFHQVNSWGKAPQGYNAGGPNPNQLIAGQGYQPSQIPKSFMPPDANMARPPLSRSQSPAPDTVPVVKKQDKGFFANLFGIGGDDEPEPPGAAPPADLSEEQRRRRQENIMDGRPDYGARWNERGRMDGGTGINWDAVRLEQAREAGEGYYDEHGVFHRRPLTDRSDRGEGPSTAREIHAQNMTWNGSYGVPPKPGEPGYPHGYGRVDMYGNVQTGPFCYRNGFLSTVEAPPVNPNAQLEEISSRLGLGLSPQPFDRGPRQQYSPGLPDMSAPHRQHFGFMVNAKHGGANIPNPRSIWEMSDAFHRTGTKFRSRKRVNFDDHWNSQLQGVDRAALEAAMAGENADDPSFWEKILEKLQFWKNNDGDGDGGTGGAGRAGGGAGGMVGEAKTTGMPGQGQASGDAKDANKKEPWTPPSAWPQGKPAKQKDKSRDKSGETGFV